MRILILISICFPSFLISQSPEVVKVYNQGVAAAQKKQYQQAIKFYNEALLMDPLYPKAYYNRANAKLSLKDYQGASSDFGRCLKLDPENGKAHYYKAYCNLQVDDYPSALKGFTYAIKLRSQFK